jgi:hypothetical protein
MPTLISIALTGCLAVSLVACSNGPPKLALPDGLHRVPINRVSPVPEVPMPNMPTPPVPVSPDRSVSSGAGAGS